MKILKKYQKGNTAAILLIVAVLVILGFWWLMKNGYKLPGQTAQTPEGIQNTADLDAASKQLDATDLNQMDTGINQVSADSRSF